MMDCLFCHQPTKITYQEMANDTFPTIIEYHCQDCRARFTYSCQYDCLHDYHFMTGDYAVWFYPPLYNYEDHAGVFEIVKKAEDGFTDSVLTLSFIPNITPQNFHSKLPILLAFQ